jgi:hypothetical protein
MGLGLTNEQIFNPEEELTLFLQSFQHALGRRTYAVQSTADLIKKFWFSLSQQTRDLIQRDLGEAIERDNHERACWAEIDKINGRAEPSIKCFPLGMNMDRAVWVELAEWIEAGQVK